MLTINNSKEFQRYDLTKVKTNLIQVIRKGFTTRELFEIGRKIRQHGKTMKVVS